MTCTNRDRGSHHPSRPFASSSITSRSARLISFWYLGVSLNQASTSASRKSVIRFLFCLRHNLNPARDLPSVPASEAFRLAILPVATPPPAIFLCAIFLVAPAARPPDFPVARFPPPLTLFVGFI